MAEPDERPQAGAETDEVPDADREALRRLQRAFDAGDYRTVRAEAEPLARGAAADEVRRAARALRARIDPDPLAVGMIVLAVALLAGLVGWYGTHKHEAPAPAPKGAPS